MTYDFHRHFPIFEWFPLLVPLPTPIAILSYQICSILGPTNNFVILCSQGYFLSQQIDLLLSVANPFLSPSLSMMRYAVIIFAAVSISIVYIDWGFDYDQV